MKISAGFYIYLFIHLMSIFSQLYWLNSYSICSYAVHPLSICSSSWLITSSGCVYGRSCSSKVCVSLAAAGYREIVIQSLPQISALDGFDRLGNPSHPGLGSPCDVPGLEDYVDLLLSTDTSHNEAVSVVTITPLVASYLYQYISLYYYNQVKLFFFFNIYLTCNHFETNTWSTWQHWHT